MLRKSQPNFQYYVKKIEAQVKNGFPVKTRVLTYYLMGSSEFNITP